MSESRLKGACYVVNINDGHSLIEVNSFDNYADALEQFNQTIRIGSFGRWKEVYLEGRDKACQFVDIYCIHYFDRN